MNWDIDYGDLASEKEFVNNCENLKRNLQGVQKVLDQLTPLREHYDKMTIPDKIELDLFLVFTLNSLQWINLRIHGIDPTNHPIKDELERVKVAMKKWQEMKSRNKRPQVDIRAARRFIKSGLYNPYKGAGQPINKKIKFTENDE